jgi:hypothetical protein
MDQQPSYPLQYLILTICDKPLASPVAHSPIDFFVTVQQLSEFAFHCIGGRLALFLADAGDFLPKTQLQRPAGLSAAEESFFQSSLVQ